MKWLQRFASLQNFLDPLLTNDGQPYGPWRYKQIVKECYLISKNCNTSYVDILKMNPTERGYLLEFISDEYKKTEELVKEKTRQNK